MFLTVNWTEIQTLLSKTLSLIRDRKSSCSRSSCISAFAQRQITRLVGLRSGARLSPLVLIPAQVPQCPALCPGDLQVPRLLSGQCLIVMSQGRGTALVPFLLSLPLCALVLRTSSHSCLLAVTSVPFPQAQSCVVSLNWKKNQS